jgi:hypothetical protein
MILWKFWKFLYEVRGGLCDEMSVSFSYVGVLERDDKKQIKAPPPR